MNRPVLGLTRAELALVLAATFLFILHGGPAAPTMTARQATRLAHWAGVGPEVLVVYRNITKPDDFDAGFIPGGVDCELVCVDVVPTVYVALPADMPDRVQELILLHEVGHYHQWVARGRPDPMFWAFGYYLTDPVGYEWDADTFAANAMCARWVSGPATMIEAWQYLLAHILPDYTGDRFHGALVDRLQFTLDHGCALERVPPQAA